MNNDKQIDDIFQTVDAALWAGEFESINHMLEKVETYDITILVAWLAITIPAKEKLPARKPLIERVRRLEPERADRLLKGLE